MLELKGKKIEFDLEEFVPLLLSNKQEGFRKIGKQLMEKEFEIFIGVGGSKKSCSRIIPGSTGTGVGNRGELSQRSLHPQGRIDRFSM